ncbi:hypothetical protein V8C86DRAFT_3141131 [Haematococcus lacustris]
MAQVTSSPVVATQKLVAIADLKDIQPAGPPTVQTTLETRVNGSGDTPGERATVSAKPSELPTLSSGPSTETSSTLPLLALAGAAGLVTSMAMAGALALAALGALTGTAPVLPGPANHLYPGSYPGAALVGCLAQAACVHVVLMGHCGWRCPAFPATARGPARLDSLDAAAADRERVVAAVLVVHAARDRVFGLMQGQAKRLLEVGGEGVVRN